MKAPHGLLLGLVGATGLGVVMLLRRSGRARGVVEDVADAAAAAVGVEMASEHFSLAELSVTGQDKPNVPNAEQRANLVFLATKVLEPIRSLCGDVPVKVTSAFRSEAVNAGAGGSSTSDHSNGLAADIYVSGLTHEQVAELLHEQGEGIPLDQVIIERHTGHLHIGAGTRQRRQFLQTSDGNTYTAWKPEGANA